MEKREISRRLSRSSGYAELSHVVLLRTAKKCTKIYNARAQLLFCSLNLLFGDVLVAVVVEVCLSFLINNISKQSNLLLHFNKTASLRQSNDVL